MIKKLKGKNLIILVLCLVFLFSFIRVNDLNYGIEVINNFHGIVTSGMGGWGYAMRTAKHSEIVVVNLKSS